MGGWGRLLEGRISIRLRRMARGDGTLEEYRGRALGRWAVEHMIEHMRREGREPVWGAAESNSSSLRLAEKLGFVPVDAIAWFSRGPWAFLTAGFEP